MPLTAFHADAEIYLLEPSRPVYTRALLCCIVNSYFEPIRGPFSPSWSLSAVTVKWSGSHVSRPRTCITSSTRKTCVVACTHLMKRIWILDPGIAWEGHVSIHRSQYCPCRWRGYSWHGECWMRRKTTRDNFFYPHHFLYGYFLYGYYYTRNMLWYLTGSLIFVTKSCVLST